MILRWIVTRIKISRWIVTAGHDSTLNCDPGSWFHVEFWPQVKLWSGIGITIQCGILTRGHKSTWNFDPVSQFNVEFWPVYISSTRGIATQEGVRIQQRDQNSTAKEGHNSTQNPLNIYPGSVFNGGVKILSYTGSFIMPSGRQRYLRYIDKCFHKVKRIYTSPLSWFCDIQGVIGIRKALIERYTYCLCLKDCKCDLLISPSNIKRNFFFTLHVCVIIFMASPLWLVVGPRVFIRTIIYNFKNVSSWLLNFCSEWEGLDSVNWLNHTSWVAVVTQTDRPKSVRNRCIIEGFGAVNRRNTEAPGANKVKIWRNLEDCPLRRRTKNELIFDIFVKYVYERTNGNLLITMPQTKDCNCRHLLHSELFITIEIINNHQFWFSVYA